MSQSQLSNYAITVSAYGLKDQLRLLHLGSHYSNNLTQNIFLPQTPANICKPPNLYRFNASACAREIVCQTNLIYKLGGCLLKCTVCIWLISEAKDYCLSCHLLITYLVPPIHSHYSNNHHCQTNLPTNYSREELFREGTHSHPVVISFSRNHG